MSVPQIKDRPASALRAMFAGIGSLLSGKSGKDKMRAKPAAEAPADVQAPASQAVAPQAAAPQAAEADAAVADAPPRPATAEPAVVEVAAVEVAAETAPAAETAAAPVALPLANYDDLTVASLRARLRTLSNDDLVQLREYEQAHQDRPEVVKMFTNRLVKMTTGLPKLEA